VKALVSNFVRHGSSPFHASEEANRRPRNVGRSRPAPVISADLVVFPFRCRFATPSQVIQKTQMRNRQSNAGLISSDKDFNCPEDLVYRRVKQFWHSNDRIVDKEEIILLF
jgi:hypothetical protein